MLVPYSSVADQQLYLGDSLEVLKELPTGSVQAIITGPPYFEMRSFGNGTWEGGDPKCNHKFDSGNEGYRSECPCGARRSDADAGKTESLDEYVNNLVKLFAVARDVLSHDGVMWLVSGDSYSDGTGLPEKNLYGAPWQLALALQRNGWILRSDIVWEKTSVSPLTARDRPTHSHDYIFMFAKNQKYKYYTAAAREAGKATGSVRNYRTVWSIAPESFRASGYDYAVFPRELVGKCVRASTVEGDTILDPFCGAATVGAVSMQMGRKSIGVELSPKYIAIADERLRALKAKLG